MKKEILLQLERMHTFTVESYMQITGLSENEKAIGLNQLARAEKNGQIFRIKRGLYITGEFYRKYYQDERFLPALSQILYPESYVYFPCLDIQVVALVRKLCFFALQFPCPNPGLRSGEFQFLFPGPYSKAI